MAVVYWIHLEEHTDMFTQGYIGVSKNTAKGRFRNHLSAVKSGSKYTVHNAIRKYGNRIVLTTILEGDAYYCYEVEGKLRPEGSIGWNIREGGEVSLTLGYKHSQDALSRMSLISKLWWTPERREAQRKVVLERGGIPSNIAHLPPWNRGRKNHEMWKRAGDVFLELEKNPSIPLLKLSRLMDISHKTTRTIVSKIKAGWIPSQDEKWLLFKASQEE